LQERYSDSTDRSVQECCSIHRNRIGDKEFHQQFDVSIVWSYDCYTKKIWISCAYNDNDTKQALKIKFLKYCDYFEGDGYISFSKYSDVVNSSISMI